MAMTLAEVCAFLSVSEATALNWLRLGKLKSLDSEYIRSLKLEIESGADGKLKSRRNKRSISGKSLYKDYISSPVNLRTAAEIMELFPDADGFTLRIILAFFALKLFLRQAKGNALRKYLAGDISLGGFECLIDDLLDRSNNPLLGGEFDCLSETEAVFVKGEDFLGFLYISLRDLGQRKNSGAYYTPQKTVAELIENLRQTAELQNKKIFDPCCGTGNFLLGFCGSDIDATCLYGQDIDIISVQIARINMALNYKSLSVEHIRSHFVCGNTLYDTFDCKFDIILGNPPWGSRFSAEDKKDLSKIYETANLKGVESYDLFIEKSLSMLYDGGYLAFVLPQSVLTVRSHAKIRNIILKNCSFKFVSYLDSAFSGVQCPAVIMGLCFDKSGNTVGCKVRADSRSFVINSQRDCFSFNVTDEEQECIDRMESVSPSVTLKNNAVFALGIVTGDNKAYIKTEPMGGYEAVLKGGDIKKYRISPSGNYIKFEPGSFQQCAPTEIYRAKEKLLYRFISSEPVFAYDDKQRLSLNSCNILIPHIDGMNIKYILAVLNSRAAAFYIGKKFASVKLLRSHIEALPIPEADKKTQREIVKKVDEIILSGDSVLYDEIDDIITELYGLNENQKNIINRYRRKVC